MTFTRWYELEVTASHYIQTKKVTSSFDPGVTAFGRSGALSVRTAFSAILIGVVSRTRGGTHFLRIQVARSVIFSNEEADQHVFMTYDARKIFQTHT